MRTPRTIGSVVLSVELVDLSQGPVVSFGPHENVLEGLPLVDEEESRGISDGPRSCSNPSIRISGIGCGLTYG